MVFDTVARCFDRTLATSSGIAFEFSIGLGKIHDEIVSNFSLNGDSRRIWFHRTVDLKTGIVAFAGLGLLADNDINTEKRT